MKKVVLQMKRTLSTVLAIMMVATSVPQAAMTVMAADEDIIEAVVEDAVAEDVIVEEEAIAEDTVVVDDTVVEDVIVDPDDAFYGFANVQVNASGFDVKTINGDDYESLLDSGYAEVSAYGDLVITLTPDATHKYYLPKFDSASPAAKLVDPEAVEFERTGDVFKYTFKHNLVAEDSIVINFAADKRETAEIKLTGEGVTLDSVSPALEVVGSISNNKVTVYKNDENYYSENDYWKTVTIKYTADKCPDLSIGGVIVDEYSKNIDLVNKTVMVDIPYVTGDVEIKAVPQAPVKLTVSQDTKTKKYIKSISVNNLALDNNAANVVKGDEIYVEVEVEPGYVPVIGGTDMTSVDSIVAYTACTKYGTWISAITNNATINLSAKFDSDRWASVKPGVSGNGIAKVELVNTTCEFADQSGKYIDKDNDSDVSVKYYYEAGKTFVDYNISCTLNNNTIDWVGRDSECVTYSESISYDVTEYVFAPKFDLITEHTLTFYYDKTSIKEVNYATKADFSDAVKVTKYGQKVVFPISVNKVYVKATSKDGFDPAESNSGYPYVWMEATDSYTVDFAMFGSDLPVYFYAYKKYDMRIKAAEGSVESSVKPVDVDYYTESGDYYDTYSISENGIVKNSEGVLRFTQGQKIRINFSWENGYRASVKVGSTTYPVNYSDYVEFIAPAKTADELVVEYKVDYYEPEFNTLKFTGKNFKVTSADGKNTDITNGVSVKPGVTSISFNVVPSDAENYEVVDVSGADHVSGTMYKHDFADVTCENDTVAITTAIKTEECIKVEIPSYARLQADVNNKRVVDTFYSTVNLGYTLDSTVSGNNIIYTISGPKGQKATINVIPMAPAYHKINGAAIDGVSKKLPYEAEFGKDADKILEVNGTENAIVALRDPDLGAFRTIDKNNKYSIDHDKDYAIVARRGWDNAVSISVNSVKIGGNDVPATAYSVLGNEININAKAADNLDGKTIVVDFTSIRAGEEAPLQHKVTLVVSKAVRNIKVNGVEAGQVAGTQQPGTWMKYTITTDSKDAEIIVEPSSVSANGIASVYPESNSTFYVFTEAVKDVDVISGNYIVVKEDSDGGISKEFKIEVVPNDLGEDIKAELVSGSEMYDGASFKVTRDKNLATNLSGSAYRYRVDLKYTVDGVDYPGTGYANVDLKNNVQIIDTTALDGLSGYEIPDDTEFDVKITLEKVKYDDTVLKTSNTASKKARTAKCYYEYNLKLKKKSAVVYKDQNNAPICIPVWSKTTTVRKLDLSLVDADGVDHSGYAEYNNGVITVNALSGTLPAGKYTLTATTKVHALLNDQPSSAVYKFEVKDRYFNLESASKTGIIYKVPKKAATAKFNLKNVADNKKSSVKVVWGYDVTPTKYDSYFSQNASNGTVTLRKDCVLSEDVNVTVYAYFNQSKNSWTDNYPALCDSASVTFTPDMEVFADISAIDENGNVVNAFEVGKKYYVFVPTADCTGTPTKYDAATYSEIICSDKKVEDLESDDNVFEFVATKKGTLKFTAKNTIGSTQKNKTKSYKVTYRALANINFDPVVACQGTWAKDYEATEFKLGINFVGQNENLSASDVSYKVTAKNAIIVKNDVENGDVYFYVKDSTKPVSITVKDNSSKLSATWVSNDITLNTNKLAALSKFKQETSLFADYNYGATNYISLSTKSVDSRATNMKLVIDRAAYEKTKAGSDARNTYTKLGEKSATLDGNGKWVIDIHNSDLKAGSYKYYAYLVDASDKALTKPTSVTIKVVKAKKQGKLSVSNSVKMCYISGNEIGKVDVKLTGSKNKTVNSVTYKNACDNKGNFNEFTKYFDVKLLKNGNVVVYLKKAGTTIDPTKKNEPGVTYVDKKDCVFYLTYDIDYGTDEHGNSMNATKTIKVTVKPQKNATPIALQ